MIDSPADGAAENVEGPLELQAEQLRRASRPKRASSMCKLAMRAVGKQCVLS